MKKIILLAFTLLVFVACTGRRYGHYSYVKNKKAVTEKLPRASLYLKKEICPPLIKADSSETFTIKQATTEIQASVAVPKPQKRKINNVRHVTKQKKTNTAKGNPDEGPTQNMPAEISFILSLIGLITAGIGLVTLSLPIVLLSAALMLGALITGIIGLSEISNNPRKYNNKGMAITGIVISSVYLVFGLVLLVGIILLLSIVL
jgi:hypothetical protein